MNKDTENNLLAKIQSLRFLYRNNTVKPGAIALDDGEFDTLLDMLAQRDELLRFASEVEGMNCTQHTERRSLELSAMATELLMPRAMSEASK